MSEVMFSGTALVAKVEAGWMKEHGDLLAELDRELADLRVSAGPIRDAIKDAEATLKAKREARKALAAKFAPVIMKARKALGYTSGPRPDLIHQLFEQAIEAGLSRSNLEDAIRALRDAEDPTRVEARKVTAAKRAAEKAIREGTAAPVEVKPDTDPMERLLTQVGNLLGDPSDPTENPGILTRRNEWSIAGKVLLRALGDQIVGQCKAFDADLKALKAAGISGEVEEVEAAS